MLFLRDASSMLPIILPVFLPTMSTSTGRCVG